MRPSRGKQNDEAAAADAYTDAPLNPDIQGRIEYIAALMSENRYHSFSTVRALATKWGLAMDTINKDAATASRLLRIPPERLEELRSRLAVTFERIAVDALRTPNLVTGVPDWRSAIEAFEKFGKFAGLRMDEEGERPSMGPVTINVTQATAENDDAASSGHQRGPEQVPGSDTSV